MNEFSCIGLTIEDSDQMYDFVAGHEELADVYEKNGMDYLRVKLSNLAELWFYEHDESGLIDTANPCIFHKSRWMIPIKAIDILSEKKNGPVLMNMNCVEGKIDFPMNICIADGNLMENLDDLEYTGAAVSMVARELFLFKNDKDYYEQIGMTSQLLGFVDNEDGISEGAAKAAAEVKPAEKAEPITVEEPELPEEPVEPEWEEPEEPAAEPADRFTVPEDFDDEKTVGFYRTPRPTPAPVPEEEMMVCFSCGSVIPVSAQECPNRGVKTVNPEKL